MPELTTKQIKFLSKYLQIVPKDGPRKSKHLKHVMAMEHNEVIKTNFAKYESVKATADALAAQIKQSTDQLTEMLGAINPERGGKALAKFRETLKGSTGELTSLIEVIADNHNDVKNAPKESPQFGNGTNALTAIIASLKLVKKGLPAPPAILDDGILGALYTQRAKILPIRAYLTNAFLNDKIVKDVLPDKTDNATLKSARTDHKALCNEAYREISADLINKSLAGKLGLNADQAASETSRILGKLTSDLSPHIANMVRVIKGAAKGKMKTLKDGGNVVAIRENVRAEKIDATVEKLKSQLINLQASIDEIHAAQGKATGFKEKQGLTADYKNAVERLESMQEYLRQLEAYEDSLALRVDRISRIAGENAKGMAMVDDVDKYIQAAGIDIAPMEGKAEILLLGALTSEGDTSSGKYENLLARFTRAATRVSVNVKLFPGEADLTDISASQFDTLKAMLTAAKTVATSGKKLLDDARGSEEDPKLSQKYKDSGALFGKANFMFIEADKLFNTFNNSNKFPLPDAPSPPDDNETRIAKLLKTAAIELDRFWGIGGDEDDSIRKLLGKAGDGYEAALAGKVPLDFKATQALLDTYTKALIAARKAFTPSPKDVEAKEKAGEARDKMIDSLLKLYTTKQRQESEIGDIPTDHLLVIKRGGKTEYHEILTKGEGNEINRRDDKQVPREAMNLMLEQATMLELLSQSEAPDSAAAIAKAIEKSDEMREGIANGGSDFANIAKQIKACDKELLSKTLNAWVPANLHVFKTNFETFKEEYTTKYLPAKGKSLVDKHLETIKDMCTESDVIRDNYTLADKLMVQIEKDFGNKKGASESNLTTKLAKIIADGPSALAGDFIPSEDEELQVAELLAKMQVSLQELKGLETKADGPLKQRILSARQTIDTKSATGIENGHAEAIKISDEMAKQLTDLNPDNGLQYLIELQQFLDTQATAATESKKLEEMRADLKAKAKSDLEFISLIFEYRNKETMTSYKELKTIYDSLKTQFKTASKTFKSDKDAKAAISEFNNVIENADRLRKNISAIPEPWSPDSEAVDFSEFQTTLDVAIKSVRFSAKAALKALTDEAADETEDDVINAVKGASDTLELAAAREIGALVKIKTSLQALVDTAFETTDKAARCKLLSKVREQSLAEVRRISDETENHPALKVYRDNPFVKDTTWPALAAFIHKLDVQVLKTLQPR